MHLSYINNKKSSSKLNSKLNNTVFSVICLTSLIALFVSAVTSCGGGGGGSSNDFQGAARVFISASPIRIDTGDRMQVSIDISEIHPDGILLKIKFPLGLRYVQASSFFKIDAFTGDATPLANVIGAEDNRFLVYSVKPSSFGEKERGKLHFELQGIGEVESGQIQVDPDVDNPLIPNSEEFNANSPDFSPEDGLGIAVS
jgi:hypothetical protein